MRRTTALLLVALCIAGCDSWVEDVDAPNNVVEDGALTDESQLEFLIAGIKGRFAAAHGHIAVYAGGLSDEFRSDPNNESPALGNLDDWDNGTPSFRDVALNRTYNWVNEVRFMSDDLLDRIETIPIVDPALSRRARFTGSFYGAIARYYLATYFGLTQSRGGGVITTDFAEPGQFIDSAEMFALALDKLGAALESATPDEIRLVKTLEARIHLISGDHRSAEESALQGLTNTDEPFQALLGPGITLNRFSLLTGPGDAWTFDPVYAEYVLADSAEISRLPMIPFMNRGDTLHVFYGQNRYKSRDDPIAFATWQENHLILAEVALHDGDLAKALMLVNQVRASHDIDPIQAIDIKVLEEERRKELWGMGLRLVDQRRFGNWHLDPGTWRYFPIPQSERDTNPNL